MLSQKLITTNIVLAWFMYKKDVREQERDLFMVPTGCALNKIHNKRVEHLMLSTALINT